MPKRSLQVLESGVHTFPLCTYAKLNYLKWNSVLALKLCTYTQLNCLKWKCLYKNGFGIKTKLHKNFNINICVQFPNFLA